MKQLKTYFYLLDRKQQELKDFLTPKHLYNTKIFENLKILLTYNSNAIEGNTLSHIQTAVFIEKGLTSEGKTINEHFEAINHYRAFDYIYNRSLSSKPFTQRDINNIHEFILDKINNLETGHYRKTEVRISGSKTTLPNYLQIEALINSFEEQLKQNTPHPV